VTLMSECCIESLNYNANDINRIELVFTGLVLCRLEIEPLFESAPTAKRGSIIDLKQKAPLSQMDRAMRCVSQNLVSCRNKLYN